MSRKCLTDSDSFRFICGEFTSKAQREESKPLKRAYHLYFGIKVGDQNKTRVPCKCGTRCNRKSIHVNVHIHQCLLQYQWFGENRQVIQLIVIFV